MVYGMAYWSVNAAHAVDKETGKQRIPTSFNDSKQLTEDQRDKLWEQIIQSKDIGFGFKALLPNEISRNMFRHYNLNEQSHDTAMTLIRKLLLQSGGDRNSPAAVTIQTCYIDTVGNASLYQRKLQQEFPGIEFIVESKADAKYAPCSAASVGA
jgi:ribonuclease H2 subunit A